jgi:hypothetical protein
MAANRRETGPLGVKLMACVAVNTLAAVLVVGAGAAGVATPAHDQAGGSQYQIVKVCSLLPVAEVKKLAPWEPMFDQMKIEEEGFGGGSSCNYPTATVQVMQFRQGTIDALAKGAKLEPVAGVGDAAWLRNNRDEYAELMARVGPHLLTVQLNIDRGKTFDSSKPTVLGLGKAFAARLR